jgi:hypothetical protein
MVDQVDRGGEATHDHDGSRHDSDDTRDELAPVAADPIAVARRRYGGAGVALAAAMFGLDKVLTDKPSTESVQIQESPSDPHDVDEEGIELTIADTTVAAPALARRALVERTTAARRRRRARGG